MCWGARLPTAEDQQIFVKQVPDLRHLYEMAQRTVQNQPDFWPSWWRMVTNMKYTQHNGLHNEWLEKIVDFNQRNQ